MFGGYFSNSTIKKYHFTGIANKQYNIDFAVQLSAKEF